jgi:hypothetical protein
MATAILIFLIALTAGVLLAARWLPYLGDGPPTSPTVTWAISVLAGTILALSAVVYLLAPRSVRYSRASGSP